MLSKCCKRKIICSIQSFANTYYDYDYGTLPINGAANIEIDYKCSKCKKYVTLKSHPELHYIEGIERLIENYIENE